MNLNTGAFRNDEVELLRASEIADAGVRNIGGLVSRNNIIPHAHFLNLSELCDELDICSSGENVNLTLTLTLMLCVGWKCVGGGRRWKHLPLKEYRM